VEAKTKAVGAGLAAGAAFVALFGLGFMLATIAVALALVLDTWLALLVVTLGLVAVAGGLGLAARAQFQSGGVAPRRELEAQRQELNAAVERLKRGVGNATNVAGKLRGKLPVVAAGALGAGFFVAGGVGATMRFLARKGRER
jgi:hypothetical protein